MLLTPLMLLFALASKREPWSATNVPVPTYFFKQMLQELSMLLAQYISAVAMHFLLRIVTMHFLSWKVMLL